MDDSLEETGLAGLTSNTESISKGVFAFRRGTKRNNTDKKSSKKSKKKRAKTENVAEDLSEYFGKTPNAKFRHDLYNKTWDMIWSKMKNLQKDTFDKVLLDAIKFCEQSQKSKDFSVVPTCALVTGVNLPDHQALFKLLIKSIRKSVSEHVAIVRSSECGTLKILVKKILLQLHKIHSENDESSSDEDDEDSENESEETTKTKKGKKAKFVPTLSNMVTWYENQYDSSENRPPLVVIFEDFEGFTSPMLQDLIANLQAYREKLPFLLIFGVATTVDVIHRTLPHGTTSKMAIHSFSSVPSIHLLANFVEALVMDLKIPFKLSGRVLEFLLTTFSLHDLSVNHFLMGLKCCLLEHFSTNESTVLCCSKSARDDAISQVKLKQLSKTQYELSKVEGFDLKSELEKMDEKMLLFNSFVAALHSIVASLPRSPLGKNFHHVLVHCMSEPITQGHEYRDAFQYLKMSERTGLTETLTTFSQSLRKNGGKNSEILETVQKAEAFIKELKDIETSVAPNDSLVLSSNLKSLKDLKSESPNKKLDRESLKQVLLEQAREKKLKKMNPYELLRDRIMTFLHETMKKYLEDMPSKWVWHDIFYYDDINTIKQMLTGAPRNVIQLALKTPYQYLKVPELEAIKKDEIPPVLPDISIAYKLHLECGRLINLYDWLQCWLSIINNDMDTDDNDSVDEGKVVSERMHARFSRAVSELQFLGFIKPSKRKTDHVERLTY